MMRRLVTMAGVVAAALWSATAAEGQRPVGPKAAAPAAAKAAPTFLTKSGYAACISRSKLDTLALRVAQHDSVALRKLLTTPKSGCFRLKGGVRVVPVATDNLVVQIRPAGAQRTVYTVLEALRTVAAQDSVVPKTP